MISKEEVKHIAKLARLDLSEKETERMRKDLSEILDYFNLLKKAPSAPTKGSGAEKSARAWRKDEVLPRDAGMAEKIIEAFPDKKDGYIKVKAIL